MELLALKHDLRSRFETSPYAFVDFALREQTAAILSTMSADELATFAREFDKEPGNERFPPTTPNHALLREIMRQWALKDPSAASLDAARHPERPASQVFEDWLKRDLQAAEAWLKSGAFTPDDKVALDKLQKSFLKEKVADDFDSARKDWSKLDPKSREEVLVEWGEVLAHDPVRRSELLRLLEENGDEEVRLDVYRKLTGTMAARSPKEAVEFVEAADLPEASKDALYDKALVHWSEKNPKEAIEWWIALDRQEAPPRGLAAGMFMMGMQDPELATGWVRDLPSGKAREGFEDTLMESLLAFYVPKAADFSASIEDSGRRHKYLREVYRKYSEQSSAAANRWLDGLPEEDSAAVRNP
ncbi:hypothetical protein [Luteolibacter luteus]|uniref:Uncharacterized protein n=1 Tax=Luteolibacter luteus TaxID=2728835 RepID=A0A858RHH8_9BACT|nr:hypothetical protein [Luteolibacter luteus]QJE96004.1 hypothetical protein HHL09_09480 [Luteolibacter luteus]